MTVNYDGRCVSYGPGNAFAIGLFAEDHAFEAWERMTYSGLGFHPTRAHIMYSEELVYRVSQTRYVKEGSLVAR